MKQSNKNRIINILFVFGFLFVVFTQVYRLLGLDTTYLGESVDTKTLYYFLILLLFLPVIVFVFVYTPITLIYQFYLHNNQPLEEEEKEQNTTIVLPVIFQNPLEKRRQILRC